jgi:hypothetical protein
MLNAQVKTRRGEAVKGRRQKLAEEARVQAERLYGKVLGVNARDGMASWYCYMRRERYWK